MQKKSIMCYCLGDIVGYGAEPNECIAILRDREYRALPAITIRQRSTRAKLNI